MQVNDFREIARQADTTLRMPNINTQEGKSRIRRIMETAIKGLKRLGCGRDSDLDVVMGPYDMPEPPLSSRPSEAGTSSQRRMIHPRRRSSAARMSMDGITTTTTFPRQDSSLLHDTTQVFSYTKK